MPEDITSEPTTDADTPDVSSLPNEDRLREAAQSAQQALAARSLAQKLKDAASTITDPKKREATLQEAHRKEVEAHGNSRKAKLLSSGVFHGGVGGAGLGAASGAAVGTLVGTLVGTVTAIPTTAIGGLAGMGVGAIHGPWYKLSSGGADKGKAKDGRSEESPGAQQEGDNGNVQSDESEIPDPDSLNQAADIIAEERSKIEQEGVDIESPEGKKRPRKIEIRSKSNSQEEE